MTDQPKKTQVLQNGPKEPERGELSVVQQERIAKFVDACPTDEEEKKFDAGFEASCKLAKAEDNLAEQVLGSTAYNDIEKSMRRIEDKITPHKRQWVIRDRAPLVRALLKYINAYGAPKNVRKLTQLLRDQGALDYQNKQGLPKRFSEEMVRDTLRVIFGFKGNPGRRSNTQ